MAVAVARRAPRGPHLGVVTDQLWAILAILVVVLLAGGAALTAGLRRRRPPEVREEPEILEERAPAPIEGDTATEPGAGTAVAEPPAPAPVETERPAPVAGRMVRLRERLARSGAIGRSLLSILSRDTLSETDWEEIEETLLLADVGIGPTTELMDRLRTRVQVLGSNDPAAVRDVLREELLQLVDPSMDRSLRTSKGVGDDGTPHRSEERRVGHGAGRGAAV